MKTGDGTLNIQRIDGTGNTVAVHDSNLVLSLQFPISDWRSGHTAQITLIVTRHLHQATTEVDDGMGIITSHSERGCGLCDFVLRGMNS